MQETEQVIQIIQDSVVSERAVNRPREVVSNDLEELVHCVEITDGSFERSLGVTITNYTDLHRKQRLEVTLSVVIAWIEKGARPDKSEAEGYIENLRTYYDKFDRLTNHETYWQ